MTWYISIISSAGPDGDRVLRRIADLIEVGADVLERQGRVVVALGSADEESGDLTAADREDLAGDRAVCVGQVCDHGSDERGVEPVKERTHQLLGLWIVDRGRAAHRVVHHSGRGDGDDRVDLDIEAGRFCREHARQPDDSGLGGAVVGHPRRAEDARRGRGVDDAAEVLLPHDFPCRPGHEERALEVHVHQRGQPLFGHVLEIGIAHGTCVVDEDVDAAPRVDRGVDDGLAAFRRCDAVGVGDGFSPVVPDLLRGVVGRIAARSVAGDRAAEVVDDDACAAGREQERVLPAQPPARSGDHGYLLVESQLVHYLGQSSGRGW